MRSGCPTRWSGTRYYDRREIRDAMAYLRAVVNPADEVSVKRILNVPAGDRRHQRRQARPLRGGLGERVRRCVATPTTPASADRRYAASPRSSPCSTRSPPDSRRHRRTGGAPPGGARGRRLPRRAGGRGHVEAHGRSGEPRRADRVGARVHPGRRVPRTGVARRRHGRAAGRRHRGPGTGRCTRRRDSSSGGVPRRRRGGRVRPSSRALSEPDDMEEERRLAYVGITRARNRLFICHAWSRSSTAPPPTTRRRGSSRRSREPRRRPGQRVRAHVVWAPEPAQTAPGGRSRRPASVPRGARRHDDRVGTDRSDAHRTGRRGGDRRWPAQRPEPSDAAASTCALVTTSSTRRGAKGWSSTCAAAATPRQRSTSPRSASSISTWPGHRSSARADTAVPLLWGDAGRHARREPHREHVEGGRADRRRPRSGGLDDRLPGTVSQPDHADPGRRHRSRRDVGPRAVRRRPDSVGRMKISNLPAMRGKRAAVFCTFALNPGKSLDRLTNAVQATGADVVGGPGPAPQQAGGAQRGVLRASRRGVPTPDVRLTVNRRRRPRDRSRCVGGSRRSGRHRWDGPAP